MPTNDKVNIWAGGTFAVEFECLEPVAEGENSFGFGRTPITPISAIAQLWSVNDQAYLEIGSGLDPTEDNAEITDNVVKYIVSSEFTALDGDYKLFISVTFLDGQVVTEMRQFRVKEKQ